MKILELEIENFGRFTKRRFSFGDGGFQLVTGPNEAGKSTLLALIRNLLFGFPHRSEYAFAQHNGDMAATALIDLSSGARVRFRRRKGRGRTVVGEVQGQGAEVDDAALARMLGGAGEELYRHVFGFSLNELAAGRDSLERANLSEALYGGGIGGLANFQAVQDALRKKHEELFVPRGQARPINKLLQAIKEKRRDVQQAAKRPAEYKTDKERCEELEDEANRLHQRLDDLYKEKRRLERLEKAHQSWRQLCQARGERDALDVPDGFPPDAAAEFQRIKDRLRDIENERAELDAALEKAADELKHLVLAPEIISREADIRRLVQEMGKIKSNLRDLPDRQTESRDKKREILADLAALNPQWSLEHLDRFPVDLARREQVEALKTERDELEQEIHRIETLSGELAEQLKAATERVRKLSQIALSSELENLVENEASQYQADCRQVEQYRGQIDELRIEIEAGSRRLSDILQQEVSSPANLPVPLDSTVTEFRDRVDAARESVAAAQRELNAARNKLAASEEQLAMLDAAQHVPSRDELQRQRDRRDAGWRIIRRKFIDAEPCDDDIAEWLGGHDSLPDCYEHEVASADRLADDRQVKATVVAQRDQLLAAISKQQEHVAEASTQLARQDASLAEVESGWRELWRACGFVPLSPMPMLDWLREQKGVLESQQVLEPLQRQLARLEERTGRFEAALKAALAEVAGSTGGLLEEARRRVRTARDAASRRSDSEAQVTKSKRRLDKLEAERARLVQQRTEWDARWQSLMEEFGFPDDWTAGVASRILAGLAEARQKYQIALSLDKRVEDMTSELTGFEAQVRELCRKVAADLLEHPAVDAVAALDERLQKAIYAKNRHEALRQQKDRDERASKKLQTQQADLLARLTTLRRAANAETDEQFHRIAEQARRQQQLDADIRTFQREIDLYRSIDEQSEFLAALEAADPEEIASLLRQLEREIPEVDQKFRNAEREAGVARDRLDALSGESEAARLELERQGLLAEFTAAVDAWAPLAITHALMARAIEKFEREQQPEMLAEVSRLIEKMTAGRYVRLRRRLDEHGTLLLDQCDGEEKDPSQLSTGTREQLYLAIRLAYVRHYCRNAEPLPLVMDDVLVNFDDARARRTLDVLLDLAGELQIVFLTCHENIADMIVRRAPGITPIELDADFAS